MSTFEILGCILFGGALVIGVIGVIVEKIRNGKSWIGQGYGRK